MVRPERPERNRAARSFRQLRRFHHVINSDKVFGTHSGVKALSDQQIADLKAGRGMGFALAAEVNGYPGPSHVLEFADVLQLSDKQRSRTTALLEAMKAETIPLGERIIAAETSLDRLFAERRVTRASLDAAISTIGTTQGELRAAHLRYHLSMIEVLSTAQIAH